MSKSSCFDLKLEITFIYLNLKTKKNVQGRQQTIAQQVQQSADALTVVAAATTLAVATVQAADGVRDGLVLRRRIILR